MADDSAAAASPLQIEIANRIIAMIRESAVKAGDHLTEEGLAKDFGVSRSPVRAALRLLEERGYVEIKANAGVFVSKKAPRLRMASFEGGAVTEEELYRSIITDRAKNLLPETLSEAELLARYGVPKGVLMRTLLRMTHQGLIERRKGHGWQFLPALESPQALAESYRYRMIVECGALREPTFSAVKAEMEKSRQEHRRFLDRGAQGRTPSAFFEMNANFHEMLARFSGNRFILQAIRQQNQLRRIEEYAHYMNRSIHIVESCQEHLQILDAIDAGDREWAAALLYRHLSMASRV